ncbi:MAG: hypothetical protein WKF89_12505 [Chitinophagaceae bacterium]
MPTPTSPHIHPKKMTIEFSLQNHVTSKVSLTGISQVSLAGTFNNWAQDALFMKPDRKGVWKIEIPMLPKGVYQYKFFIDDKMWMEDVDNPNRQPDGLTGFNSILYV